MLVAEDLTCGYGARAVLSNATFSLPGGELVALVGPNGIGKSTLLKTLTGYLSPLSGNVTLDDADIAKMPPGERAKRIAYVPQSEPPVFDFLVKDVVAMGRTPHGDEAASGEKIETAMAAMELLDLRDRPITQISGGELQRTLIARALVQETPHLLLDEPTSHLDLGHQASVMSRLRDLVGAGKSALCVTQDLNLAAEFADRVIFVSRDGFAVGSPSKILTEDRLRHEYGTSVSVSQSLTGRPSVRVERDA